MALDGVDLRVARAGFERASGSLGVPGEMCATVSLSLDDGETILEVHLGPADRDRLVNELRFGDSVSVPREYNELREDILRERREHEKG